MDCQQFELWRQISAAAFHSGTLQILALLVWVLSVVKLGMPRLGLDDAVDAAAGAGGLAKK